MELLDQIKWLLEQYRILMTPHPLTNFQIQRYDHNEPRFNSVYSRNNLPKINFWVYMINLDEYKLTETH